MRKERPIPAVTLTEQEREMLEQWPRRGKSAQALAQRARIILACADGPTNTQVAARLRLTQQTIGKWRGGFVQKRLDGLLDELRPGTPHRLAGAEVERVLVMTLKSTPKDATHWSTRSMAEACGLSRSSVHRIWRAFALAPHRTETFKISKDPLFIEKVRDIVGLYPASPDKAMVLCVGEKAQIQALDGSQPVLPMKRGQLSDAATTTPVTGQHLFLLRLTPKPEKSSANCIAAIDRWSSASSSTGSMKPYQSRWKSISFSTITVPIRRRQ